MRDFRKLYIWQRSHALTLRIYKSTAKFPSEERFGLTYQIRKSSSSVSANIAEGSRRKTELDFARFVNQAEGSMGETESFLILSKDLGYLSDPEANELAGEAAEVSAMMYAFRQSLEMPKTPAQPAGARQSPYAAWKAAPTQGSRPQVSDRRSAACTRKHPA